jgi:hypothetical protein
VAAIDTIELYDCVPENMAALAAQAQNLSKSMMKSLADMTPVWNPTTETAETAANANSTAGISSFIGAPRTKLESNEERAKLFRPKGPDAPRREGTVKVVPKGEPFGSAHQRQGVKMVADGFMVTMYEGAVTKAGEHKVWNQFDLRHVVRMSPKSDGTEAAEAVELELGKAAKPQLIGIAFPDHSERAEWLMFLCSAVEAEALDELYVVFADDDLAERFTASSGGATSNKRQSVTKPASAPLIPANSKARKSLATAPPVDKVAWEATYHVYDVTPNDELAAQIKSGRRKSTFIGGEPTLARRRARTRDHAALHSHSHGLRTHTHTEQGIGGARGRTRGRTRTRAPHAHGFRTHTDTHTDRHTPPSAHEPPPSDTSLNPPPVGSRACVLVCCTMCSTHDHHEPGQDHQARRVRPRDPGGQACGQGHHPRRQEEGRVQGAIQHHHQARDQRRGSSRHLRPGAHPHQTQSAQAHSLCAAAALEATPGCYCCCCCGG